ncbi:MAG TPA: response regulator [Allosphingosinicella sp.]|jgi:DNA-binding response OmpR family regulator
MSEQLISSRPLDGRRILIVEDEYYLADDLATELRRNGSGVIGPVATVAEAGRIVAGKDVDCVILDMNLRGEMSFSIADDLERAGIPFLIATGYNSASLPDRFNAVPRVEKPFEVGQVIASLEALLG